MENRRYVINLIVKLIVGGSFFVFPFFVFGYSDTTTHPALTQEIIRLHNSYYINKPINSIDAEDIIQGSIDEDKGIRWMYHFYDPIYNRGLTFELDENGKNSLAMVSAAFKSSDSLQDKWNSSKEWAQDTSLQAGINS